MFEGYDICDLNYQPVVDMLHQMYGQPNQILSALYKQYDEVPTANESINDIAKVVNQLECYLRQLQALGINTEDMGLQQTYMKKLPNSFLLKAFSTGFPSTFQMLRHTVLLQMQLEMQFKTAVSTKEKTNVNVTAAAPSQKFNPSQNFFQKKENKGEKEQRRENENERPQKSCIFCKENGHPGSQCEKFKSLDERKKCLHKLHICEKCLREHESSRKCFALKCAICQKRGHPTFLCPSYWRYKDEKSEPQTKQRSSTKTYAIKVDVNVSRVKEVAMPITQAKIYQPNKENFEEVNVLLDSASASTFISEKLAKKLKLPIIKEKVLLEISRFGDNEVMHSDSQVVLFKLEAENGELIEMDAYTIPTLTQALPKMDKSSNEKVMVFPEILVGNDHFGKIVLSEALENGFSKIPSKLGPIICGTGTFVHSFSTKVVQNEDENKAKEIERSTEEIPKFWDTENFASDTWQENELIQHFCNTAKIVDGRIQIELPFSKDPSTLPSNKVFTLKCLESSLKRLAQNPDNLVAYDEQIRYLKDNDKAERIPENERFVQGHCLTHHGISTPEKTTPLRVVFNCSGRMSKNSPCLNDYLEAGPPLMPKIVDVLLRYRMAKIFVTGDVQKAFLQLRIAPQHRRYLRFFWIKSVEEYLKHGFQPANIDLYQFAVVIFGCKISPFFMNIALMVLFDSMKDKELGEELKKLTYADNGGIQAVTDKEAIYKTETTIDTFASVKMNFRGIMSNSAAVRQHFKVEPSVMSMLGLKWNPGTDILHISLVPSEFPQKKPITKRMVTAEIGRKYDPLGFVAPVVLRYKFFLQKLWALNIGWDQAVPPELLEEWNSVFPDELFFETPRFMGSPFKNSITEIHGFVDASKIAYAAVLYLLHKDLDSNAKVTEFLICKTKVHAEKERTIPEKELAAALLGTKLIKYILQVLTQLLKCKKYLWVDSSAVFYWLQSDKPLKLYVKNRVNIIKEADLIIQHVPTKDNPADVASRGCSMAELNCNKLWRHGPSWLVTDNWPAIIKFIPKLDDPETLNQVIFATNVETTEPPGLLYSAERAGSWIKILRVVAYCIKFVHICQKKAKPGQLTAADLQQAEKIIFKQLQQKYPPSKQTSANLELVMDKDGLIRMKSRLQHCGINDLATPLYLPDCPETKLLILREHQQIMHGGPKATLAKFRQKYWIPKGLLMAKKVISRCRICVRYKAQPYCLPVMPNLPSSRVLESSPFAFCGIDAAGPWKIKGAEVKRWILLITCLTTRAVCLEVLEDMSANACINAIIRFMGTFDTPKKFLSDHGSNFKAASTLIVQFQKVIHDKEVVDFTANHKIEWQYITERSPWKGGIYERLIGIMKNCLKFAIGRRKLTQDDFHTVTKQVQGIMNSRPIVDIDPEKDPLRPIDFLLPKAKLMLPELEEPEAEDDPSYRPKPSTADKLRANFTLINACLTRYWNKWITEYLPQLRDTCATLHKQKGLDVRPEVDDVVLIEEEELVPRGTWRLGRIIDVKEGSDGKIREASVKVGNGNVLNRSPSHLYPLEANLEPKRAKRYKSIINPIYLTVLMLVFLPLSNAYPVIQDAICTAEKLIINVTNVEKLVVRFPHRARNFNLNSTSVNITLPIELAITGGPVQLIGYSNDGSFVQQELICQANDDYCNLIDCNLCFHQLLNFECWHWIGWITVAALFLLLCLLLGKICTNSSKKSLLSAGAARLWITVKRSNNKDVEIELQPLPKTVDASDHLLKVKASPLRKNKQKCVAERSIKNIRRTSHLAVGLGIIVMLALPMAQACSNSVVIQAGKESCIIDKTGFTKCQFTEQSFITAHSETEVCLLFQSDIAPVATLTVKTFVQAKCVKTNHYVTALGEIDVQSYKHCPGVGLCFDQMCAEISPDTMVEELDRANKHVGVTSCVESCGSLTCYCPLPGTGCTFFRYFIEINEPNLMVFSCQEWKPEIHIMVKLRSSKESKEDTFNLFEGESFKFENITFHLKRLTLPFLDVFRGETFFIKNQSRVSWIDPKATKESDIVTCKANKTCELKPDICRCLPADSTVKCMCGSQHELKKQWKENNLPSLMGQHMVLPDKNLDPVAHLPAIFDMVIETTGFKASEYIYNASCEILQTNLKGRIGPEGAVLNITCQSSFGQIMGHVECSRQSFYAKCSPNGTDTLHRWYSNNKVVKEDCTLKCFTTSSTFQVYGTLARLDHDNGWNFVHGNGTNMGQGVIDAIVHGYEFFYDRILYLIGGLGAVAILVFILK
uniref:Integrase catalytic domain-containing protein n=1 Tax=Panagrolaimus superbus TaxID=310955 RepID=A0A914YP89_9BILA